MTEYKGFFGQPGIFDVRIFGRDLDYYLVNEHELRNLSIKNVWTDFLYLIEAILGSTSATMIVSNPREIWKNPLVYVFLVLFTVSFVFLVITILSKYNMLNEIKSTSKEIKLSSPYSPHIEGAQSIMFNEYKKYFLRAIHESDLAGWSGSRDQMRYEIKTKKGNRYIIQLHYISPERGPNLPSEQIEKYIPEAQTLEYPFIILSNLASLTQRAQSVLMDYNKLHPEKEMRVFCAPTIKDIYANFRTLL